MVLVEADTMVMLATCVTAPGRVLPVLANSAMACGDVTALLTVGSEAGRHGAYTVPRESEDSTRPDFVDAVLAGSAATSGG